MEIVSQNGATQTTPETMPDQTAESSLDELLAAVADHRDRSAFRGLFAYFAPRIKAYLVQSGSDPSAAEEIMQEVMITVWRRATLFDPGQASARTWVFTIARNKRIDAVRKERRPQIDPDDPALTPDPERPADRILESNEDAGRVRDAIKALPEEQRDLLYMAYFEDRPHSEIALARGLPLGTVKSRLRLALTRLRKTLKDREGCEGE